MKKLNSIVLVAIIALTGTSLFAGDNATADIDAVVQANLVLTKLTDVDFGTLQPTSNPVIDPKGASHADVSVPVIGTFSLTGAASQVVSITEGGAVTLGDGTSTTMTFTPDLEGHATTQASAADVGATVTLDGSGDFLFWLGGDLGTLNNQLAGTYSSGAANGSGAWSLDVEYN